jgi:hypothetical protein
VQRRLVDAAASGRIDRLLFVVDPRDPRMSADSFEMANYDERLMSLTLPAAAVSTVHETATTDVLEWWSAGATVLTPTVDDWSLTGGKEATLTAIAAPLGEGSAISITSSAGATACSDLLFLPRQDGLVAVLSARVGPVRLAVYETGGTPPDVAFSHPVGLKPMSDAVSGVGRDGQMWEILASLAPVRAGRRYGLCAATDHVGTFSVAHVAAVLFALPPDP